MSMDLMVVRPFGAYSVGDRVTDAQAMEQILTSENAGNVVRVEPISAPPAQIGRKKEA